VSEVRPAKIQPSTYHEAVVAFVVWSSMVIAPGNCKAWKMVSSNWSAALLLLLARPGTAEFNFEIGRRIHGKCSCRDHLMCIKSCEMLTTPPLPLKRTSIRLHNNTHANPLPNSLISRQQRLPPRHESTRP
jgi:hypothetical protein